MKGLISITLLFILAIGLVWTAQSYSGDVYVVIGENLLRMNLVLFVAAMVLLVVLLLILFKFVGGFFNLPKRFQRYCLRRQEHRVVTALNHAGLAYFEGKFQDAEQFAVKILENKQGGRHRTLALLLAAHSAAQAGHLNNCEDYLNQLAELPDKKQLSRYLLIAESALAHGDYPTLKNALESAAALQPNLPKVLELQLRYAVETQNSHMILDKAAKLQKAGFFSEQQIKQYQVWAYRDILSEAHDSNTLKSSLKHIPVYLRETDLCADIAEKYVYLGLYPQAIKWVKKYYPERQDKRLLAPLLNSVPYVSPKEQKKLLALGEEWLSQYPHDAALLSFVGQLALAVGMPDVAEQYLRDSLTQQELPKTRLILARLLDSTGRTIEAENQRTKVLSSFEEHGELS